LPFPLYQGIFFFPFRLATAAYQDIMPFSAGISALSSLRIVEVGMEECPLSFF